MKGYNFKPKANEDKRIIKFLDMQDNFADIFRYLIEKEIAENGVRDLSLHISRKRDINIMRDSMGIDASMFEMQERAILCDKEIVVQKQPIKIDVQMEKIKEVENTGIKKPVTDILVVETSEIDGQISVDEVISTKDIVNTVVAEVVADTSSNNEDEDEDEDEIPSEYL